MERIKQLRGELESEQRRLKKLVNQKYQEAEFKTVNLVTIREINECEKNIAFLLNEIGELVEPDLEPVA